MGIFTPQELNAICDRAIASGLAQNESLFFNFAPEARASIESTADLPTARLKLEVGKLNELNQRTADRDLFLSRWLRNCSAETMATPMVASAFNDWADLAENRVPDATVSATEVMRGIQSVDPALLAELIDLIKLFIGDLADAATDLMISKQLHDNLHRMQLQLPGVRQLLMSKDLKGEAWVSPVEMQLLGWDATPISMDSAVNTLPPAHELRGIGDELIKRFRTEFDGLKTAIRDVRRDAASDAVFSLRRVVKDGMADLADRIDADRHGLKLQTLIRALDKVRSQANPSEKTEISRAIASLTVIAQDISNLGRQHRAWQKFDAILWTLEEFFDHLAEGDYMRTTFQSNWDGLGARLVVLAEPPPSIWLVSADEARSKFSQCCPFPIELPLSEVAPSLFQSFIGLVRNQYYSVDKGLLGSCNRLGLITQELARL